ncbi:hypothetical protein IF803_40815 [Bradyrhizobium sp. UFLA06-06]|nr:hypothetical protein [Bradyrhizobium elkanii]NLS74142.1 hypothetical protein [Bradyrhizobium brasilense]QOZ15655.1 hypothetical protein XI02_12185 [Bradyrhizobium sp. CCBAU 21365]UQD79791.1 hypothetical protein JEY66_33695 [Bradyrhizobium elkanii USDA 76]NWL43516.1 hypothetical protein [Bradyrhizobium elkanii]NWL73308.1 hypothetical protein [Bradyrhizobium elkanii]
MTRRADPVDDFVTTSILAWAILLIYAGRLGLSSPNSADLQADQLLSLSTSKQVFIALPVQISW